MDIVSFYTDFGVTFGVFICFDVFFKQPMNSLLDDGVTHFVFPTFWFNELPFLSGMTRFASTEFSELFNCIGLFS